MTSLNTTDSLATNSTDDLLHKLSLAGLAIGVEACVVNIVALYLFATLPNCKNVHGWLCILKTASDLPYGLAMTFWWLPLSLFRADDDSKNGLLSGGLMQADFLINTITFTSYNIALHLEVLIVFARFTAVFYTFTFKTLFRKKVLAGLVVICVIVGFIPYYFCSFSKYCGVFYRPQSLSWDVLDLTDRISPCKDVHMSYIIVYIHICILALFCIILAVITVLKLHVLNNLNLTHTSITTVQKARRRNSEWVLLVVSLTSPFVISFRSISGLASYYLEPFQSELLGNFTYNFVMDFIVVQANAIIQLAINREFWNLFRRRREPIILSRTQRVCSKPRMANPNDDYL